MAVKQVKKTLAGAASGAAGRVLGGGVGAKKQLSPIEALKQEVALLKALRHRHIVAYLGCESTETTINIFLEYVAGGSVASVLGRTGPFVEDLVRALTAQVLLGLEYLHDQGVIHRDIKAANILLDLNGIAKISDFGVSKKTRPSRHSKALTEGSGNTTIDRRISRMSMRGTVSWMAPEVVRSERDTGGYGANVDIWSLGCVVLEMYTGGDKPWSELRDDFQVLYKLSHHARPPVPEDKGVSVLAKAFLERCFIVNPLQRPTATDLLQTDEFVSQVDPYGFDFPQFYREALERRAAEGSNSSLDEDEDDYQDPVNDDEYEDAEEDSDDDEGDEDTEDDGEEERGVGGKEKTMQDIPPAPPYIPGGGTQNAKWMMADNPQAWVQLA
ncbi:hypothetical protein HK104_003674 [Borealophlyctis nickersoniae]|nr:hypothetical protein HK104_003674 [Borealophlyctis nickersoniae]